MSDLKRDEIKYVRDLSKSAYKKDSECYICGTNEHLDFHHFYSMTLLWEKWKRENKIYINSVEDILKQREVFKELFHNEIYNETVTLCKSHHRDKLHKIYGKVPPLHTALKQKAWCDIQRDKFYKKVS